MERAITFHRDRHAVLSSNLANLDTPGYKPMDLERLPQPASSSNGVTGGATGPLPPIALSTTHNRHIPIDPVEGSNPQRIFQDDDGTQGGDHNAVRLERELAKIEANRVRFMATSELVTRRLALLRYSASDGGG